MMHSKRVVSYSKNANKSTTPHCSLPRVWLEVIGVTPEERDINMILDVESKQIIIKKMED